MAAGVLVPLLQSLAAQGFSPQVHEAALGCLANVAFQNDRLKHQIVEAGAVSAIVDLIGRRGSPVTLLERCVPRILDQGPFRRTAVIQSLGGAGDRWRYEGVHKGKRCSRDFAAAHARNVW